MAAPKVSLVSCKTPVPFGRRTYNGLAVEEGVDVVPFTSSPDTGAVICLRFDNSDKPGLFVPIEDTGPEHWSDTDYPADYLLVGVATPAA